MNRFSFLFGIALLLVGCADRSPIDQPPKPPVENEAEDKRFEVADLPTFLREDAITCAIFAEAVNHYVDMGEEKAIQALKALAGAKPQGRLADLSERRMAFTCRVLFEPKEGKPLRAPGLGGLINLPQKTMPLENWPLYPVAKAGASYFVLSEAYIVSGLPEPSLMYVNYCCAEGTFRKNRVPVPTRAEAVEDLDKLRSSAAWKSLKWNDRGQGFQYELNEDRVVEYMRKQAELIPQ